MPKKEINTVVDLLEDKKFISFVRDSVYADVWEAWQQANPEKQQLFDEAYLQLQVILSAGKTYPTERLAGLYDEIRQSIRIEEAGIKVRRIRNWAITGLAASFLAGIGVFWFFTSDITVKTAFGRQQHVVLPDGSAVDLNANSEIKYRRAFNWLSKRELSLRGEALFDVRHINTDPGHVKAGEQFVVSSDKIRVSVLGTRFNFKARPGVSRVSLINGKISVTAIRSGKQLILSPGQQAELSSRGQLSRLYSPVSGSTLAWTSGKLIVERTSVGDVIAEFENIYGYKVVLPEKEYADRMLDGAMSIRSEEGILFVLKNILDVNIRKEGKVIYLDKR